MALVDKKDLLRVMLLASSIFIIVSAFFALYIHSQYSGQINQVRLDLVAISEHYKGLSAKTKGPGAVDFRRISDEAEKMSKNVVGPSVNPYAYVYLNYWITSAAFVKPKTTYSELGLDNGTVQVLEMLESKGWFGDPKFRVFDESIGDWRQALDRKPELSASPLLFHLLAFVVVLVSTYLGVREKYETQVIPEVIAGAAALIPFWAAYFLGSILALLVGALGPDSIQLNAYLIDILITIIVSAFAGALAGIIKHREEI